MLQNKKYKLLYKIKTCLNCSWEELKRLSDEQAEYINHYLKHSSYLEACPGSGKTEVIGIKSAYEIYKWESENSGIAVVTFTTSAAKELNNRIRKFGAVSSEMFPHFIGTFDGWIHNYILQPFAHYLTGYAGKDGDKSIRLVDIESSAGFLSNYTCKDIFRDNRMKPIEVTEYHFDYTWQKITAESDKSKAIFKSGLSQAEIKSLRDKKGEFIKKGFATYSDIEMLCNQLLIRFPYLQKKLAQRFPVIIVDECQDLSTGQIDILELLHSCGTTLHFVGDLNQSIYEFREVNPKDISDYILQKRFVVRQLTNNYRSCQPIVDVTEKIIGNQQPVIGHENQICQQPCILWQYDDNTFTQLPQKFEDLLTANGLDKKKSVILSRGKTTVASLRTQKNEYGYTKSELFAIAFHNWYKSNRTTEDINNALFYFGKALCLLAYGGRGDSRNQYCPETSEHVEWRLLLKQILIDASAVYPYIENGQDLTWTKWVKKLKVFLEPRWELLPNKTYNWAQVVSKLMAPKKKGDLPVKEICTESGIRNIFRTTTIHSVKGETLNAVLLISHHNKQSSGGHFSHWFKEGNFDEEHIRFAYVAMSRPKYVLVLATPQLKAAELTKLQNLGFFHQP